MEFLFKRKSRTITLFLALFAILIIVSASMPVQATIPESHYFGRSLIKGHGFWWAEECDAYIRTSSTWATLSQTGYSGTLSMSADWLILRVSDSLDVQTIEADGTEYWFVDYYVNTPSASTYYSGSFQYYDSGLGHYNAISNPVITKTMPQNGPYGNWQVRFYWYLYGESGTHIFTYNEYQTIAWYVPPFAPTLNSVTQGNAELTLSWAAPSNNGGLSITNYKIYRGTTSGGETLLTTVGNVLTYTDTSGMTLGTTYYYKVSAVNSKGEGTLSNEQSQIVVTAPSAPQSPSVTDPSSDASYAHVSWSTPSSNGGKSLTGYGVYKSTSSSSGPWSYVASSSTTYWDDYSVLPGHTYWYQITAFNPWESPRSSTASVTMKCIKPSAPQSPSASPTGVRQISLSWAAPSSDGGTSITGYKIYRGTSSNGESLITTIGNTLSYIDSTGLTNDQTYYYKVSAVNSVGESSLSSETSAKTWALPGQTLNPSAIPTAVGQITLTWSAPSSDGGTSITNYKIYRGTTSGGETLLTTVGNVLTYQDSGLGNGLKYYYKVCAVNPVGDGTQSPETSATTWALPGQPQSLITSIGNKQVTLTWSAPSSDGGTSITNYTIYRGTTSGGESYLITVGNVLTYQNTGLTNGVTYYYKVSAINAVGEGTQSSEAPGRPVGPPTAPQSPSLLEGIGQISLSWTAPSNDGGSAITNYKIYRGTTSGGETLLTTIGNVLTYVDQSLINGTNYYYTISAQNSISEGPVSSEVSGSSDGPPSTAPQVLAAEGYDAQVNLSWSAPSNNGGLSITNYKIYRGTTSGGETLLLTLGNVLAYQDTGLTNGVTYYYKVSAVNAIGEGPKTSEVLATPASRPDAPTNLQTTPLNTRVVLTWAAPLDNGGSPIFSYKIYRGTTSGGEILLTTIGNVTTYQDNSLTNGVTYYYQITAVNAIGEGLIRTSEQSAVPNPTVPTTPISLLAQGGNANIVLTWAAPSDNGGYAVSGYKIYRGTSSGGETILTTVGNVLTYQDNSLGNGQTYYYKVSAINFVGEGSLSSEASVKTWAIPGQTLNLTTYPSGIGQNTLTWDAPSSNGGTSITNYSIYRGTFSGGETYLTTVVGTNWIDNSLANGQIYYYKVSAVNVIGEGAKSSEKSATTWSLPGQTLGLSASATAVGQITLTWSAPSSDGGTSITNYKIYRGTTSGGEVLIATIGNVLAYNDTSLSNGQRYYYNVSAVNAVGVGPLSLETSAITWTLPGQTLSLVASSGNQTVALSWAAPSSNGGTSITNYKIYRGTTPGGETYLKTVTNALTYLDSGLTNGVTYYYKVSAVNAIGEGAQSIEAMETPKGPPSAPALDSAISGYLNVTLIWTAPASNGGSPITGYDVYYGTSSDPTIKFGTTLPSSSTKIVVTELTAGTLYYFKVVANNLIGSTSSVIKSATPYTIPDACTVTAVTVSGTQVTITWQAPENYENIDVQGYNIYQDTGSGWELIGTADGKDARTFDFTLVLQPTLFGKTSMKYKVTAVNPAGESQSSPTLYKEWDTAINIMPWLTILISIISVCLAIWQRKKITGKLEEYKEKDRKEKEKQKSLAEEIRKVGRNRER